MLSPSDGVCTLCSLSPRRSRHIFSLSSLEGLHEQDLANGGSQLVQHVLPVPLPTEHWRETEHSSQTNWSCLQIAALHSGHQSPSSSAGNEGLKWHKICYFSSTHFNSKRIDPIPLYGRIRTRSLELKQVDWNNKYCVNIILQPDSLRCQQEQDGVCPAHPALLHQQVRWD